MMCKFINVLRNTNKHMIICVNIYIYIYIYNKRKIKNHSDDLVLTAATDRPKSSMIPDSADDVYPVFKPTITHIFRPS
jgi:hypothetical protein